MKIFNIIYNNHNNKKRERKKVRVKIENLSRSLSQYTRKLSKLSIPLIASFFEVDE